MSTALWGLQTLLPPPFKGSAAGPARCASETIVSEVARLLASPAPRPNISTLSRPPRSSPSTQSPVVPPPVNARPNHHPPSASMPRHPTFRQIPNARIPPHPKTHEVKSSRAQPSGQHCLIQPRRKLTVPHALPYGRAPIPDPRSPILNSCLIPHTPTLNPRPHTPIPNPPKPQTFADSHVPG